MKVPQILAVVVRYKTAIQDSSTIRGLSSALQEPSLAREISILLWDNSPSSLASIDLPFSVEYHWSEANRGTAGAYNEAIRLAEQRDIPWLLLLDQDTEVTSEYLQRMIDLSRELDQQTGIASIVPFIRSHGEVASPRRFKPFNRSVAVERHFNGMFHDDAYALNSGCVMRVSALREIGGYSEDFWLDLSDAYAFQQLYRQGKRMYVAGDLQLDHSIAGMNFQQDMVPERYETFLAAESAYLQLHRSLFENLFQTAWLPLRALRQWKQYRDKRYAAITWRYFLMRLTKSPATRLRLWQDQLRKQRNIPTASQE